MGQPQLPHREGLDELKKSMISDGQVLQLLEALPSRFKVRDWQLLYSTDLHGYSLQTLYNRANKCRGPSLLLARDAAGQVFGGFASHTWRPTSGFFGSGECLLFRVQPTFAVYRWSGANSQLLLAHDDCIAFGAGGGASGFGLWFDSSFDMGSSVPCATYRNECLASSQDFKVVAVEAW